MSWTHISSTAASTNYTFGWERLTCILKEGNITISSSTQTSKGDLKRNTVSFGSEISKGDIVSLSTDTANTNDATDGNPVVAASSAGANFGIVMSDPQWNRMPSSTQTVWSTMLGGGYFRMAQVWVLCGGILEGLTTDASSGTAVSPGDAVIYDNSDDGWVQAIAGGFSASDGKCWNNTADDEGANGYIAYPIALHYSASDTGKIAMAFGLIPIMTKA